MGLETSMFLPGNKGCKVATMAWIAISILDTAQAKEKTKMILKNQFFESEKIDIYQGPIPHQALY